MKQDFHGDAVSPECPEALPCAVFLLAAFFLPLVSHVLWLRSSLSRPFARPIDAGLTFRGRRLFGDNKTWRGMIALPVSAAVSFAFLAHHRKGLPAFIERGMWSLSVVQYAILGLALGLALMLAELPNSFLKRQLDVEPGQTHSSPPIRIGCMLLDRLDSVVGALIAVSLLLPILPATWLWAILLGGATHAFFSIILYRLRLKARPL